MTTIEDIIDYIVDRLANVYNNNKTHYHSSKILEKRIYECANIILKNQCMLNKHQLVLDLIDASDEFYMQYLFDVKLIAIEPVIITIVPLSNDDDDTFISHL